MVLWIKRRSVLADIAAQSGVQGATLVVVWQLEERGTG